jgi:hypothetical protein
MIVILSISPSTCGAREAPAASLQEERHHGS